MVKFLQFFHPIDTCYLSTKPSVYGVNPESSTYYHPWLVDVHYNLDATDNDFQSLHLIEDMRIVKGPQAPQAPKARLRNPLEKNTL